MKKLSIIIPVYNAEKYLKKLLDSIVFQMNEFTELILVNDGSTDNSLSVCKEYEKKYTNIFIKSIENSGSGVARNVGIECAKGEYLYFPDSDDLLCEKGIETILDSIKDNPDYVVFSYFQVYRNGKNKQFIKLENIELEGEKIRKHYEPHLISSSPTYLQGAPWNKVFKREIIMNNNIRYPSLKRHQDDAFIIEYINFVNKIKISSKAIYTYYLNMSFDESLKFPKDYFEVRKQMYFIFKKNLEKWQSSDLAMEYIDFSLLQTLKRMFMLTYSKKWNMSKKERNVYFDKILNDKTISDILNHSLISFEKVIKIIPNLSKKKSFLYLKYIKLLKKKKRNILKIMSYLLYKGGNLKRFNFKMVKKNGEKNEK